jgi:hypothetical protein
MAVDASRQCHSTCPISVSGASASSIDVAAECRSRFLHLPKLRAAMEVHFNRNVSTACQDQTVNAA